MCHCGCLLLLPVELSAWHCDLNVFDASSQDKQCVCVLGYIDAVMCCVGSSEPAAVLCHQQDDVSRA